MDCYEGNKSIFIVLSHRDLYGGKGEALTWEIV